MEASAASLYERLALRLQDGSNEMPYPLVSPSHRHMRMLLDNAFEYVNPAHGVIDAASGYPAEGWNQEPRNGLFLRSFTQLTAIGAWVELLANVAAGYADNPHISRDVALQQLSLAVDSLLADQQDPGLSAKGLLVNFIDLGDGQRKGPLLESIDKRAFLDAFGSSQGDAIWRALVEKGWVREEDQGQRGRILRDARYGWSYFDGPLTPYAADALKADIMALLDQRAVTIIFGDNANLTAALARAIGALMHPSVGDDSRAKELKDKMERFIARQEAGYKHLYDAKTGTFVFGWDATADRFVGWSDGQGNWVTGQMNYLINEFRGPWIFTQLRYALPVSTLRNAGLAVRPYRFADGGVRYALAAWDGSAFQFFGLSLFMQEHRNPAWRTSLAQLVDIELDYAAQRRLPGFLSEAYSGRGTEYTGAIGISELAFAKQDLLTDAPSLYTLGVAYMIAPEKIERFLRDQWSRISRTMTDHGPWEGWSLAEQDVIPYQTTAHTLSLILGGIGSAQENMHRYLEGKDLYGKLEELYAPGRAVDLLAESTQVHPWSADGGQLQLAREDGHVELKGQLASSGGLAFVAAEGERMRLSNGRLILRYTSAADVSNVILSFKRAKDDADPAPGIPVEVFLSLEETDAGLIEIVLPATPALDGLQEVSLTLPPGPDGVSLDLGLQQLDFSPFDAALETLTD